MAKPSIKQNAWDNWYGYIGNRKVASFFNTPTETQEQQAKRWLQEQSAYLTPAPKAKRGNMEVSEMEMIQTMNCNLEFALNLFDPFVRYQNLSLEFTATLLVIAERELN